MYQPKYTQLGAKPQHEGWWRTLALWEKVALCTIVTFTSLALFTLIVKMDGLSTRMASLEDDLSHQTQLIRALQKSIKDSSSPTPSADGSKTPSPPSPGTAPAPPSSLVSSWQVKCNAYTSTLDEDAPIPVLPVDLSLRVEDLVFPPPTGQIRQGNSSVTFHPSNLVFEIDEALRGSSSSITTNNTHVLLRALGRFCARLFRETGPAAESVWTGRAYPIRVSVADPAADLALEASEEYSVKFGEEGALLHASTVWGALRGLETAHQLLGKTQDSLVRVWNVPVEVSDAPRMRWRGLLVDTSRHFIPVPVIKQVLDGMAINKFNVFHWHITDYQSFPLASERFPLLAEKGAYPRAEEHTYRHADVRAIVSYARDRGIRVVPEIDVPGHSGSWGLGYPNITGCPHLPVTKRTLNPLEPFTQQVMTGLIEEFASLFPDKYFHTGGDEFNLDCWKETPNISSYMAIHGHEQLVGTLLNHNFDTLKRLGKIPVAWNDLREGSKINLTDGITFEAWKSWGDGLCSIQDLTTNKLDAIQTTKMYMDWESSWFEFCSMPMVFPTCPSFALQNLFDESHFLGGEGAVWTERIDSSRLLCRTFPRAIAISERMWSHSALNTPSVNDCQSPEHFARLARQQARMNMHGAGLGGDPLINPTDKGLCERLPESESTEKIDRT